MQERKKCNIYPIQKEELEIVTITYLSKILLKDIKNIKNTKKVKNIVLSLGIVTSQFALFSALLQICLTQEDRLKGKAVYYI